MYLFKENKFVSNVDVINMDIGKRTYKKIAERFGVSKRYMLALRCIIWVSYYIKNII